MYSTLKYLPIALVFSALSPAIFAQQTPTPQFSIAQGQYNAPQTVAIADATPGAKIYYTHNGTTPTTSSTPYTGPLAIRATETIEAIAVAPGNSPSSVASAKYTFVAANPVFSVPGATYAKIETVGISTATPGATILYTTNGSYPQMNSYSYSGPLTVGTTQTVCAIAVETGFTSSGEVCQSYVITIRTATPTFTRASGAFIATTTTSINDVTPGAQIYYTTDGTTPTVYSSFYNGPIPIDHSQIVQAIAVAPHIAASPAATASYTVKFIYTAAGSGNGVETGDINQGDGGQAIDAAINWPGALTFDKQGDLYIVDTYINRIRKVSAQTGVITTVAGSGPAGSTATYTGDGGPATAATLNKPTAVAFDTSGNMFIADTGNRAIRKVDAGSGVITTFANPFTYGRKVFDPNGLAFDSSDNLYVADGEQILKFTAHNWLQSVFAGTSNGDCKSSGDGGQAIVAHFCEPSTLAFDSAGNLYIDDAYSLIRKIDPTGIITTLAGVSTKFDWLSSIATDLSGNLYAASEDNNLVYFVNTSTGAVSPYAGNVTIFDWVDGVVPRDTWVRFPSSLAIDRFGNLYIGQAAGVRVVSLAPTSDPGLVGQIH